MWEKKNGTCTAVRSMDGVRLIWGPLNTGLTVFVYLIYTVFIFSFDDTN